MRRNPRPVGQKDRVRLQAFMSDAGVASRRRAEELILAGRVVVNDRVIEELPVFVDPENDVVIVDGDRIRAQPHQYWIIHKPKGVVTTTSDPTGRRRAIDFLPPMRTRLLVVGRLDNESSGLLLMTNDGELSQQISHPHVGITKVYRVEVAGEVSQDVGAVLRKGVYLDEGRAAATDVKVLHRSRDVSALEITLHESQNRQVRRMLARVGHKVKSLKRIRIGPLQLRDLPLGAARPLDASEIAALKRAVLKSIEESKTQPAVEARASTRNRRPKRRNAPDSRSPTGKPARGTAGPARDRAPESDGPRRRIIR